MRVSFLALALVALLAITHTYSNVPQTIAQTSGNIILADDGGGGGR